MSVKDIAEAKDPDLRSSMAALQRASELARQSAIQADADIVIVEKGKIVVIEAKTLRDQNGNGSPAEPCP